MVVPLNHDVFLVTREHTSQPKLLVFDLSALCKGWFDGHLTSAYILTKAENSRLGEGYLNGTLGDKAERAVIGGL
jgi:hypothetical protein